MRRRTEEESELLLAVNAAENAESLARAEANRQLWLADPREELAELVPGGVAEQLTESLGDPLLGNAGPA